MCPAPTEIPVVALVGGAHEVDEGVERLVVAAGAEREREGGRHTVGEPVHGNAPFREHESQKQQAGGQEGDAGARSDVLRLAVPPRPSLTLESTATWFTRGPNSGWAASIGVLVSRKAARPATVLECQRRAQ